MQTQVVKEKLKRRLLSGHTEVDETGVSDFIGESILPLLFELGIEELSVILVPKQGGAIIFSTSPHLIPTVNDLKSLISCLDAFGSSRFVVNKDLDSYLGYSENDLDWVVIRVADEYRNFCEELMGPFWYQFYEH